MAFELTYQPKTELDTRKFSTRTINWEADTTTWEQVSNFELTYYARKP